MSRAKVGLEYNSKTDKITMSNTVKLAILVGELHQISCNNKEYQNS